MSEKLRAEVILKDGYGQEVEESRHNIFFHNICPVCLGELEVKRNIFNVNGLSYGSDIIVCKNKCEFKYHDLLGLEVDTTRF